MNLHVDKLLKRQHAGVALVSLLEALEALDDGLPRLGLVLGHHVESQAMVRVVGVAEVGISRVCMVFREPITIASTATIPAGILRGVDGLHHCLGHHEVRISAMRRKAIEIDSQHHITIVGQRRGENGGEIVDIEIKSLTFVVRKGEIGLLHVIEEASGVGRVVDRAAHLDGDLPHKVGG